MAISGGSQSLAGETGNVEKKLKDVSTQFTALGNIASVNTRVMSRDAQIYVNIIADTEIKVKSLKKQIAGLEKTKISRLDAQIEKFKANLAKTEAKATKQGEITSKTALDTSGAGKLKHQESVNKELTLNKQLLSNKATLAKIEAQRATTPNDEAANLELIKSKRKELALTTTSLSEYRKGLKKVAENTKEAADNTFEFGDRIGIALQKILIYRGAFLIFTTISNQIRDAVQAARDFDEVIQDLKKVIDPSQGSVQKLADSAFSLGTIFGKSAKEVATTFSTFAQQGLNVDQILNRTVATMLLSATSAISLEDSVQALTAVFEAYPEYVNNATLAVDKWASVQAKAPLTTQDLAMAMKQIGITAREVGVSFDQLSGIVAAINEVTRKSGKEIGNSLKTMFANIVAQDAITQLQSLGINVMKTKTEFRGIGDVLNEIKSKWGAFTNQQRVAIAQLVGDKRRYSDFIALMENYNRFVLSTADSIVAQGEASKMAEFEFEKFNRQIESIKTNTSKLSIAIGNSLLPTFISFFKYIGYTANALINTNSTLNYLNLTLAVSIALILSIRKGLELFGIKAVTAAAGATTLAAGLETVNAVAATTVTTVSTVSKVLGWLGAILAVFSVINFIIGVNKAKKANEEFDKSLKDTNESLAEALEKVKQFQRESYENKLKKDPKIKAARKEVDDIQLQMSILEKQEVLNQQIKKEEETAINNKIKAEKEYQELLKGTLIYKSSNPLSPTGMELPKVTFASEYDINKSKKAVEEAIDAVNESARRRQIYWDTTNIKGSNKPQLLEDLRKVEQEKINTLDLLINPREEGKAHYPIDKITESLTTLQVRLDNIKKNFGGNTGLMSTFLGKGFDKISAQYEELNSIWQESITILKDRKIEQEKIAILEKLAGRKGINTEQLKEYQMEIAKAKANISLQDELRDKINTTLLTHKEIVDTYWDKQAALERNKTTMEDENSALDTQVKLLGVQGKGIQKMSSMRAIDATLLKTVMNEEMEILDLQKKKEINEAQHIKQESIIKYGMTEMSAELEYQAKLRLININYAEKEKDIIIQEYEQAIKLVRNIRDEVKTAFSTSLVDLPGKLTEVNRSMKNINKEKKEAEKQLALARQKGDAEAINSANQSLNDINNKMIAARQQQIKAFTDVFGSVGDVAIKRWGENLANYMLNESAAEKLASGIIPASTIAALKMYQAIIAAGNGVKLYNATNSAGLAPMTGLSFGSNVYKNNGVGVGMANMGKSGGIGMSSTTISAVQQQPQQVVQAFNVGSSIASTKLERALDAGGSLAAVGIMKAMGIGTGEISNSLANFGGMLGSAFGAKGNLLGGLGAFGGPVGTILGSLLGAGIGSLLEEDPKPYLDSNTEALKANTTAVDNNNKLLELERQFINAPVSYKSPPAYGSAFSGQTAVNIVINGGNSSSTDIAKTVVKIIDEEYTKSARRSQSNFNRFGR